MQFDNEIRLSSLFHTSQSYFQPFEGYFPTGTKDLLVHGNFYSSCNNQNALATQSLDSLQVFAMLHNPFHLQFLSRLNLYVGRWKPLFSLEKTIIIKTEESHATETCISWTVGTDKKLLRFFFFCMQNFLLLLIFHNLLIFPSTFSHRH